MCTKGDNLKSKYSITRTYGDNLKYRYFIKIEKDKQIIKFDLQ